MRLFLIVLILLNFLNLIKSETIILNADKCIGKSNCYYNDIWNAAALVTDDIVFVTTDPVQIPTVNLPSRTLAFNTLNVSNVILNIMQNGKTAVTNSIYVGPKASIIFDAQTTSSAGSIFVDGSFKITSKSGALTITNDITASSSGVLQFNGSSVTTGSLNVMKGSSDLIISGNPKIVIKNDSNIETNVQLIGSPSLLFKNGTSSIYGISNCVSTASIVVSASANIKFGQSNDSNLLCLLDLANGSNLFFTGTKLSISNVKSGSSTNMYLSSKADVTITNQTPNLILYYVSIDDSQITFDNTLNSISTISSSSSGIINLKNLSNFKIDKSYTLGGHINLIGTELNIGSNVTLTVNSGIDVDPQSSISIPTDSKLSVGGSSNLNSNLITIDGKLNIFGGLFKFNQGLTTTSSSSIISSSNSTIEFNGDTVLLSGKIIIDGDNGQLNLNSVNNKFKNSIIIESKSTPTNIKASSFVTLSFDSKFNSPVYCYGDSIINIIMGSNIEFNGGLNNEVNSILNLQNSKVSLNSISNIFGAIQLNNGTVSSSGSSKITNKITSSNPSDLGNNLIVENGGACTIDSTNTIDISGSINVLNNSVLTINNAIVSVGNEVNNSGKIVINSLLNTTKSFIQTSADSHLVLLEGSNIVSITSDVNLQSGRVSGTGNITSSNKCQCGGTIDSVKITIIGDLDLLSTSKLDVSIFDNINNYSKIFVSGNVNIAGGSEINLILNGELKLKNNDTFQIITCSSPNSKISGSLTIVKDIDSNSFKTELSESGTSYNLIYHESEESALSTTASSTTGNDHSSTGKNVDNSSFKLAVSLPILILSLIFTLFF